MANDAREIYEAVLGELRRDLAGQVRQYENRISTLEKQVLNLQTQLAGIQAQVRNQMMVGQAYEYTNSTVKRNTHSSKKIDMSKFDVESGFQFNGWVYYANEEMGDFLYKVRTDGTDNQQLTDYSVSGYGFKVENGRLYFEDKHWKSRTINL